MSDDELTKENVEWDGSGDPNDTQKRGHSGNLGDAPGGANEGDDLQPQAMADDSQGS